MSHSDLEDWENRVAPAVTVLESLASSVVDDLDVVEGGGVGWWSGMTSWKHLALLSDYLIQSLHGAAESLRFASLATKEHRGVGFSLDFEQQKHWDTLRKAGQTSAEELASVPRGPSTRRQEARRDMTREQVLYHLVQALDRVSPAVLIVGAFNCRDVDEADWGTLQGVASQLSQAPRHPTPLRESAHATLAPLGTRGRELQTNLLELVLDPDQFGQDDWLPWLRETRNTSTHRAPGVSWLFLKGKRGKPEGFHYGLVRYPKRSTVEILVHLPRHVPDAFAQAVLAPSSSDVLEGLLLSTTRLLQELAARMQTSWFQRRADPSLLLQPGRQWRDLKPAAELSFEGDGAPVPLLLGRGAEVRVGPELSRRIQAARILDVDEGRSPWDLGD